MKFVAPRLAELLGEEVVYVPETRGEALSNAVKSLKDGQVLLMQNTRYEKGESKNVKDFKSDDQGRLCPYLRHQFHRYCKRGAKTSSHCPHRYRGSGQSAHGGIAHGQYAQK